MYIAKVKECMRNYEKPRLHLAKTIHIHNENKIGTNKEYLYKYEKRRLHPTIPTNQLVGFCPLYKYEMLSFQLKFHIILHIISNSKKKNPYYTIIILI